MNKSKSSIFWGIVVILVGVIFLGNNLELWNLDIFFDGWWSLFIIIPSLLGLIRGHGVSGPILGLIIGILLLLAAQDVINWNMVGEIFVPALIIVIGLSLVFRPKHNHITYDHKKTDEREYTGIFSGCEEKINDIFIGATCTAVFGGIDLDLKDAIIKDDVEINCVSVFGGCDFKLPDNVIVKTSGVPVLGGVENKYDNKKKDKVPTVYINYVCVFGGVEIK